MVRDLKALGLWDKVMVNDLKKYYGSMQAIERSAELKQKYATAFEVEPRWLVDAASRRQKWIDQTQSLNLYIAGASGKKLDITYHGVDKRTENDLLFACLKRDQYRKSTLDRHA